MVGDVTVYLVGAGPGDPGLLTVRGRELLERCDALVYDRLADPRIVAIAPATAERVYAGKQPGGHTLSQEQINAGLVELAGRHRCVVRLKGGDPFVFGRGGEEGLALAAAGVEWEVVPGVSSAYAVPAYAGIPVTHRGLSAQVTFVTGHEDPTKPGSDLDWASLAASPGTLVFLMGVGALAANAARLIEHGMAPDTPAAVISRGTRPGQRTVTAPLDRIADEAAGLPAPAITLVGAVAGLRPQLTWFERRPLFGIRVAVTRARAQASGLAARLSELGADVVEAPSITIEPIEFEHPDLSAYDIVCVTSANGVERLMAGDVRALQGVTVAAVGRATADALAGRGVVADVVPAQSVSDALPEALGDVRGRRVLVATAEGARPALPDGLRERGADVEVLHTYRTVREPVDETAVAGCDLVSFTSSSTVENVLGSLSPGARSAVRAVSIGPVTTESLRRFGVEPLVEADPHDVDGLVDAVLRAAAIESRPGRAARSSPSCPTSGRRDPFVGICHGVISRTCPDAVVIHVAHGIEPTSVGQGARVLAAAVPYLPVGVHMAVVDPGVGSERRGVCSEERDGRLFVGPDNGLLMPAADACGGIDLAVEITNSEYMLRRCRTPSTAVTCSRRCAGTLRPGSSPSGWGLRSIVALVRRGAADVGRRHRSPATVQQVDRFGNIQLSASLVDVGDRFQEGRRVVVESGDDRYFAICAGTFADVDRGELVVYEDSERRLSIAINRGHAAELMDASARTMSS